MPEDNHPAYLDPSELGTKDYWETFYNRTLSHLSSKTSPLPPTDSDSDDDSDDESSDPGTSWFAEHNAPEKVLAFISAPSFPLAPCNTLPSPGSGPASGMQGSSPQNHQPNILDLGSGNGSMLALLRKRGFRGALVGVDYSEASVRLARELVAGWLRDDEDEDEDEEDVVVAGPGSGSGSGSGSDNTVEEARPVSRGAAGIRFEAWDVLSPSPPRGGGEERELDWFPYARGGFDVVLDKGTFDAVSLAGERDESGRRVCERYPAAAARLVRPGGFLVVTSCNWTEEELGRWFVGVGGLRVWGRVEYPRFRFGGREGQGVCTVCFERV